MDDEKKAKAKGGKNYGHLVTITFNNNCSKKLGRFTTIYNC